jgi:hypothetical protein
MVNCDGVKPCLSEECCLNLLCMSCIDMLVCVTWFQRKDLHRSSLYSTSVQLSFAEKSGTRNGLGLWCLRELFKGLAES